MPQRRPQPDLDRVREALRARDQAPGPEPGSDGLHEGVSVTALDLDGDERFQPLRRELGASAFGLNLIRLRPGQRGRIHRHEHQEEVYVVLEGTLTLEVEREPHELPRGCAIRVAPNLRRRLANAGGEPLAVLAIGGATPHQGRDGVAFAEWEDETGASPQDIPLPEDLEL